MHFTFIRFNDSFHVLIFDAAKLQREVGLRKWSFEQFAMGILVENLVDNVMRGTLIRLYVNVKFV